MWLTVPGAQPRGLVMQLGNCMPASLLGRAASVQAQHKLVITDGVVVKPLLSFQSTLSEVLL